MLFTRKLDAATRTNGTEAICATPAKSLNASNGSALLISLSTVCPLEAIRSVYPSAGALTTLRVPGTPGRFSTTSGWFQIGRILSARTRDRMSVTLPDDNGTTIFTRRDGYCCAASCAEHGASTQNCNRKNDTDFADFHDGSPATFLILIDAIGMAYSAANPGTVANKPEFCSSARSASRSRSSSFKRGVLTGPPTMPSISDQALITAIWKNPFAW